jgi:hypothetical protein
MKFLENLTRITGALHEDLCTFMTISRSVLLIIRNVSDRFVDKIKSNILCSTDFFSPNIVLFVNNVEKYDRAIQAANDKMAQALGMLVN